MSLIYVCNGAVLCCIDPKVSSHIACSGCSECCDCRMDLVCKVVEVDVF